MKTPEQREAEQREMRERHVPKPRLTRADALNQLAQQIESMSDGPEKTAALMRYLQIKGRRRVMVRGKRERGIESVPAESANPAAVTLWSEIRRQEIERDGHSTIPDDPDALETYPVPPHFLTCADCRSQYVWMNANGEIVADCQLCPSCHVKWQELRRAEDQRPLPSMPAEPTEPQIIRQLSVHITESL